MSNIGRNWLIAKLNADVARLQAQVNDGAVYKRAVMLLDNIVDCNPALLAASRDVENGLRYEDIPDATIIEDNLR